MVKHVGKIKCSTVQAQTHPVTNCKPAIQPMKGTIRIQTKKRTVGCVEILFVHCSDQKTSLPIDHCVVAANLRRVCFRIDDKRKFVRVLLPKCYPGFCRCNPTSYSPRIQPCDRPCNLKSLIFTGRWIITINRASFIIDPVQRLLYRNPYRCFSNFILDRQQMLYLIIRQYGPPFISSSGEVPGRQTIM